MLELDLGKVTAIHPESNAVDLEIMRDGRPVAGAKVFSPSASSSTGLADLPDPADRTILAGVAWMMGHAVVIGFMFPEVAQCLFSDKGRMVYRHGSDVYITIDDQGNTEVAHPSGAFVRLAVSPEHEDLTGKDYDAKWRITRNTDKPVHIHVEQAGGVASVNIAPDGALAIQTKSTVDVSAKGAVGVSSDESIDMTAPAIGLHGAIELDGPVTQGKGGNGGGCEMAGPLTVTDDVVANGISVSGHTHTEQGDGADVSAPK